MKPRATRGGIAPKYLALALAAALVGTALLYFLTVQTLTPYHQVQKAAAERMARAEQMLLQTVENEGIFIEDEDVNRTGLIGPEFDNLTTSLGHLEAKCSTLNPNFAALLVRFLTEAGLKKGDTLAVGSSGSFPGMSIATVCAAAEMGLDARVIVSFGSSMYGGTRAELPTVRMLQLIKENGVADFDLLAVSPGGSHDEGDVLMVDDSREIIAGLAEKTGVEFINTHDLEKSIKRRLALYGDKVRGFVNIGGASANVGESTYTLNFPNGLVTVPPRIPSTPLRGLMYEYAARGLPVVHLLNVRQLCADHGLPYDPVPLPAPGEGQVYFNARRPVWAALAALALSLVILLYGRKKYLEAARKQADEYENM